MVMSAQSIVIRFGMAEDIPALKIGELGWDVDKNRLRAGDGTPTPPMIMTTKSTDAFEYKFISYVEYPEIRMLPEGTVDGVDISDLNVSNGILVRRGDNLWAQRTLTNTDTYITIQNPAGTAGNPVFNLSDEIVGRINDSLQSVAVDDVTIHGNGRPEAPLYAHSANYTQKGVSRFATGQEVIDGILSSVGITPESLIQRLSTFTRTGLIRKATLAEVRAALSTDTVVVPAYIKTAVIEWIEEWYNINATSTSGGWGVMATEFYDIENPNTTIDVTGVNGLRGTVTSPTSGTHGGAEPDAIFYIGNYQLRAAYQQTNTQVFWRAKNGNWYAGPMGDRVSLMWSGDSDHIDIYGPVMSGSYSLRAMKWIEGA